MENENGLRGEAMVAGLHICGQGQVHQKQASAGDGRSRRQTKKTAIVSLRRAVLRGKEINSKRATSGCPDDAYLNGLLGILGDLGIVVERPSERKTTAKEGGGGGEGDRL